MNSITVIMPTFNGEKYISDQLYSIIEQLIPGDELILCDDCSIDSTVNIINDFCLRFPKIKFLRNERNMGVNYTIKKLVSNIQTEKFCFVDQDDIWLDGRLILIRNTNNNLVVVPFYIGEYTCYYQKLNKLNIYLAFFKNTIPGCSIGGSSKIIKNLCLSNNFTTLYDYFIIVKAVLKGVKFDFDSQPRFIYRRHASTLTKLGWAVHGYNNVLRTRLVLIQDLFRNSNNKD
jgi:glycosyltransferase involved in cell wall biosynthesis